MGSALSKCADDPDSCCFDPASISAAVSETLNNDGGRPITVEDGLREAQGSVGPLPLASSIEGRSKTQGSAPLDSSNDGPRKTQGSEDRLPLDSSASRIQEYVGSLQLSPGLPSGAIDVLKEMEELLLSEPTAVFDAIKECVDAFTPAAVYVGPALVFVSMIMSQVKDMASNPVQMRKLALRLRALQPVLQAAAKLPTMIDKHHTTLSEMTKVFKKAVSAIREASASEKAGWWVRFWAASSIKSKLGQSTKNLDEWVESLTVALVAAFGEEQQRLLKENIAKVDTVSSARNSSSLDMAHCSPIAHRFLRCIEACKSSGLKSCWVLISCSMALVTSKMILLRFEKQSIGSGICGSVVQMP